MAMAPPWPAWPGRSPCRSRSAPWNWEQGFQTVGGTTHLKGLLEILCVCHGRSPSGGFRIRSTDTVESSSAVRAKGLPHRGRAVHRSVEENRPPVRRRHPCRGQTLGRQEHATPAVRYVRLNHLAAAVDFAGPVSQAASGRRAHALAGPALMANRGWSHEPRCRRPPQRRLPAAGPAEKDTASERRLPTRMGDGSLTRMDPQRTARRHRRGHGARRSQGQGRAPERRRDRPRARHLTPRRRASPPSISATRSCSVATAAARR